MAKDLYVDSNATSFKGTKKSDNIHLIGTGDITINTSKGTDTLCLDNYIEGTELTYEKSERDLVITNNTQKITLKNYFSKNGKSVSSSVKTIKYGTGENTQIIDLNTTVSYIGVLAPNKKGKVTGTAFNDTIDMHDQTRKLTVNAGAGDDTIISGKGNDTITGGKGTNTFIYNEGSGSDTVRLTKGEKLVIKYVSDTDLGRDDFIIKESGKNVVIIRTYKDTQGIEKTDKITIKNMTKNNLAQSVIFEAGTNADSTAQIFDIKNDLYDINATKKKINGTNLNERIFGTSGNDKIKAGGGDDVIYSGVGNDKIYGGKGIDTYVFGTYKLHDRYFGSGNDVIYDAQNGETIEFTDSNIEDLTFTRSKNKKDLIITYRDMSGNDTTENTVTVKNYYKKNLSLNIKARNGSGNVINTGTDGDDIFTGTEQADVFIPNGGHDQIINLGDGDTIVLPEGENIDYGRIPDTDDLVISYGDDNVITVKDYYKDGETPDATITQGDNELNIEDEIIAKNTHSYSIDNDGESSVFVPYGNTASDDILDFAKSDFDKTTFTKDGDDLIIEYHNDVDNNGEKGTLVVEDYFTTPSDDRVDSFVDKDGQVHSLSDATVLNIINGTDTNDSFTGTDYKDVFIPNGGYDQITNPGAGDVIVLPEGPVHYAKADGSDDLIIFYGPSNELTVSDYFKDDPNPDMIIRQGDTETNLTEELETKLAKLITGSYDTDDILIVEDGENYVVRDFQGPEDSVKFSEGENLTFSRDVNSGDLVITYGENNNTVTLINYYYRYNSYLETKDTYDYWECSDYNIVIGDETLSMYYEPVNLYLTSGDDTYTLSDTTVSGSDVLSKIVNIYDNGGNDALRIGVGGTGDDTVDAGHPINQNAFLFNVDRYGNIDTDRGLYIASDKNYSLTNSITAFLSDDPDYQHGVSGIWIKDWGSVENLEFAGSLRYGCDESETHPDDSEYHPLASDAIEKMRNALVYWLNEHNYDSVKDVVDNGTDVEALAGFIQKNQKYDIGYYCSSQYGGEGIVLTGGEDTIYEWSDVTLIFPEEVEYKVIREIGSNDSIVTYGDGNSVTIKGHYRYGEDASPNNEIHIKNGNNPIEYAKSGTLKIPEGSTYTYSYDYVYSHNRYLTLTTSEGKTMHFDIPAGPAESDNQLYHYDFAELENIQVGDSEAVNIVQDILNQELTYRDNMTIKFTEPTLYNWTITGTSDNDTYNIKTDGNYHRNCVTIIDNGGSNDVINANSLSNPYSNNNNVIIFNVDCSGNTDNNIFLTNSTYAANYFDNDSTNDVGVLVVNNSIESYVETANKNTGKTLTSADINTLIQNVAGWLTDEGRSYESVSDVFTNGTASDKTALITYIQENTNWQ